MKQSILFTWIGHTDLRASRGEIGPQRGPVAQAIHERAYSRIYLLSNYDRDTEQAYQTWLAARTDAPIEVMHVDLTGPTEFAEIYEAARAVVETVKRTQMHGEAELTYHLSPGTPAMTAIWILLAKTLHPAELIESSQEHGVRTVSFPFEVAADYLPDLRKSQDEIARLTQGLPPEAPEFREIVHRCHTMRRLVAKARHVAVFDITVLIQGESGTGKELFARAIRASSSRSAKPFIAINCGAIPESLMESELFGYGKGAFTGATKDKAGYLEEANGGTLFLDEVGELSLSAQVKLLRALQEHQIYPVGSRTPRPIDIRVIAATNRNLPDDVATGRFREDLFHRLAIGVLRLPPLRERREDINLLIDSILAEINTRLATPNGWTQKKISAGARNLLRQHPWPGNVRELMNTLTRAAIWTMGDTIQADDIKEALFSSASINRRQDNPDNILFRPLGPGFELRLLIGELVRHYLARALSETDGNKSRAAALLGLPSYQTLINWMKRYGKEP